MAGPRGQDVVASGHNGIGNGPDHSTDNRGAVKHVSGLVRGLRF
ncbi:MAG: hypothetical protein ACK5QX_07515 [bacterium]